MSTQLVIFYLEKISEHFLIDFLETTDLYKASVKSYKNIKKIILVEKEIKINRNFIGLIMSWEISLFSYSIKDIDIILRLWDFLISLKFYKYNN